METDRSADHRTDLPADVLEALHANRKILAIRLLREQRDDLDLKASKEAVDAYLKNHPHLARRRRPVEITGRGTLFLAAILILAAWMIYRLQS